MTYSETLAYIYALGRFGIKPGLERISRLLDNLGNPQASFTTIHVAGTNGKGSTASFLSSILSAGGYRTGLFTSPHLISFTERIRIDGAEIEEESVVRCAERVIAAAPEQSTFFEIVTAMAALHFADQGVDLAVFEVGMGGRLDATNALPGILSLITPVSLDHTEYLGSSIDLIAREKAGICKPGRPVVVARQLPEAARVIEAQSRDIGAPLYRCGEEFDVCWEQGRLNYRGVSLSLEGMTPGLSGFYQSENAAVAVAAAELLSQAGFPVAEDAIRTGVANASWPGRMEMFPGRPRVLLDGAHNPAGAQALAEALSQIPRGRLLMVTGVMGDKELSGILSPLLPLADELFAVAPGIERAMPAEGLAQFCREAGARSRVAPSVAEGIEMARAEAGDDDLVLVCGSLFTVGEARSYLLSRKFEPFRG